MISENKQWTGGCAVESTPRMRISWRLWLTRACFLAGERRRQTQLHGRCEAQEPALRARSHPEVTPGSQPRHSQGVWVRTRLGLRCQPATALPVPTAWTSPDAPNTKGPETSCPRLRGSAPDTSLRRPAWLGHKSKPKSSCDIGGRDAASARAQPGRRCLHPTRPS